jgi:hypothetical protein
VLLLFTTCYIITAFYKEDFSHYDNDILLDYSLRGKNYPLPIWHGIGRFLPLQYQEFNLLRFVTTSSAGYHALAVAQLIIVLIALLVILGDYGFRYRTPILIAVMLTPSFVISFLWLICPERNVLFWLSIVLLCLHKYPETKGRIYFVGCLVATHFALYYKETTVVVVAAYPVMRLLSDAYVGWRAGHRSWRGLTRQNTLALGLLGVSGIYIVLFLLAMLPESSFSYVNTHQAGLGSVFWGYLQTAWLPFILVPVLVLRFGRFALYQAQLDPMWDCLGVGALACFLCLMALRMYSGYYTAPVDLIALLYLARVSLSWLSKPTRLRVSIVTAAFACLLVHSAAYSLFSVIESKSLIAIKSQLADFLKSYVATSGSKTVEVYFPYADGFPLMGLSSYLRYRGLRLAGQAATSSIPEPTLVIEGAATFPDNRCVGYKDYACLHRESAPDGALIVVLPDDKAPMAAVDEIGKHAVLLFSTETRAARGGCGSWLRLLHAISPHFSEGELPEHWLQLHVFKKT